MRAAEKATSTKIRPTPNTPPALRKPAGGYQFVPTASLAAVWGLKAAGLVDAVDVRVWFAAWEMEARRRPTPSAQPRLFDLAEMASLTGLRPARLRRSLRRLAVVRLLDWSEQTLGFPDPIREAAPHLRDSLQKRLARFPRPGGRIPVPRRILRLLARGVRPALAATIVACLVRCLRFKRGVLEGRGRIKASWIAETFDVSERRVKEARGKLTDLGWLIPLDADQQALNRWGLHVRIDLGWSLPADFGGAKSSPPPTDSGAKSSPPLSPNRKPLTGEQNQKPARGGPTGFFQTHLSREIPEGTIPKTTPTPLSPAPTSASVAPIPRISSALSPIGKPNLRDVKREDLDDVDRTLDLYDQAVEKGMAVPSEWGRLRFLAAAQHAKAVANKNPCGLFAQLVREGLWKYATQADEDEASRRLKRHLNGPPPNVSPSFPPPHRSLSAAPDRPPLSEDARFVQTVIQSATKLGSRIDPFLVARRGDAAWTRTRWDQAVAELQQCRKGGRTEESRSSGSSAPLGPGAVALGEIRTFAPKGAGA